MNRTPIPNLGFLTPGSQRVAWTGGDAPPPGLRRANAKFRAIVSYFFQEQLAECGGLDLWKCAGTTSMERARIFWRHALYDAWATVRANPSRYDISIDTGHEGIGSSRGTVRMYNPRVGTWTPVHRGSHPLHA